MSHPLFRKQFAEEATGVRQSGSLRFYHKSDPDNPISSEQAREWLLDEEDVIAVPAAGAGSYNDVAVALDLGDLQVINNSSSAGDWLFKLLDRPGWFMNQTNRYPYHGFAYSVFSDAVLWYSEEEGDG